MAWLMCISCPLALHPQELTHTPPPAQDPRIPPFPIHKPVTLVDRILAFLSGRPSGVCPRCGSTPWASCDWLTWVTLRGLQGGSRLNPPRGTRENPQDPLMIP